MTHVRMKIKYEIDGEVFAKTSVSGEIDTIKDAERFVLSAHNALEDLVGAQRRIAFLPASEAAGS